MVTGAVFLQPVAATSLLLLGLTAAVVIDCRSHRIPNRLVMLIAFAGIGMRLIQGGIGALPDAAGGLAVGFALLLPFYLLGGMAAGDVKLMAAAGAWLGIERAAWAVTATLVAGGLLGATLALWAIFFRMQLAPGAVASMIFVAPRELLRGVRGMRFPYAIAVAIGVLTSLLWRPL